MVEFILVALFAAGLLLCVAANFSVLYALLFGYALFFGYGVWKKHSGWEVWRLSLAGVRTVQNIVSKFILIGMITAAWRVCGTIPWILYHASALCIPSLMLLTTFLLCGLMSFLTGSSFGTVATAGVICGTLCSGMGIPVWYTGGAVLSGVYFGDRGSPMSTSAILVSELTKTDIFRNVRTMAKTSLVPFCVTCLLYWGIGTTCQGSSTGDSVLQIFAEHFQLSIWAALPAAVILLLSLLRVPVGTTMGVSIAIGAAVALGVQKVAPLELLRILLWGYHPADPQLAEILQGGGVTSMLKTMAIVALSSSYAGIFEGTGFLNAMKERVHRISNRLTPYGGLLLTSVLTGAVACNQTLSVVLTHQLCTSPEYEGEELAADMENSVIIVTPLIPWCIAAAVPLTTVGAPDSSILLAFYLWLIPLWNLLWKWVQRKKRRVKAV